jgi:tRNA pseudouridine55 synthase
MPPHPNILLIDKPKGITSFDVIRILRKKLGYVKMGHAGTLDPLASGLMLVGIGDGTKELSKLIGLQKSYIAEILLGSRTASGDLELPVIETRPVPELSDSSIEAAVSSIVGAIELPVPVYSAVQKNGQRLYTAARAGAAVEAPIRTMHVIRGALTSRIGNTIAVEFEVGSGTYVRSLAEELGRRLGTIAVLTNLRRTAIGPYRIEDAEELQV